MSENRGSLPDRLARGELRDGSRIEDGQVAHTCVGCGEGPAKHGEGYCDRCWNGPSPETARCQHCPCLADERSFMCEDCASEADQERDNLSEEVAELRAGRSLLIETVADLRAENEQEAHRG